MEKNQSKLRSICGLKIVDVDLSPGDAGLAFEDGATLAIYNAFQVSGFSPGTSKKLIGKSIKAISEDESKIVLTFEGQKSITIDMRDEAYWGPEAIQLCRPDQPIVVWN